MDYIFWLKIQNGNPGFPCPNPTLPEGTCMQIGVHGKGVEPQAPILYGPVVPFVSQACTVRAG